MPSYPYNPMNSAGLPNFPLMVGPMYQPFMSVPAKRSDTQAP
jgi:hypothetical protein